MMKRLKSALLGILILGAGAGFAASQTTDLGTGVFTSNVGDIILTIDASLAIDKINSPYVMFMAFMVAKGEGNAAVDRNDVTMTWNGQEYKMPTLVEWRKNYNGAQGDMTEYRHLGHDALVLSQLSTYKFTSNQDYFPILGRGPLPTDVGSMSDSIGFMTKLYFKNPGFKKGDQIVIAVRDKKKPNVTGSCAVILK
jgi:hypothetical protein